MSMALSLPHTSSYLFPLSHSNPSNHSLSSSSQFSNVLPSRPLAISSTSLLRPRLNPEIQCTKSEAPPEVERVRGVSVYKPKSYQALVTDAATSLFCALNDGKTRIEIDFPPLPSDISSYKGSSDEFSDANIQLALALVQKLQEKKETRACIVFPDKPEKRRASELFKAALDSIDGISIGSLDDVPGGAVTTFFRSIRNTLDFDFEDDNEGCWQSDEPPSLYIFIICSTRELTSVEKYVFVPVFYFRRREYSKTVAVAPYIVNYTGALFRQYPGPWQVMLKQTDNSYACVAESATRFTLGETKEELLRVLGLQEEQGSSLEFLRRGYKYSTWWEEDVDLELHTAWRS